MSETLRVGRLFYINLDQRTDRDEHVRGLLQTCPWPNSRVSAVRLQQPPEELGYKLAERHARHPHVASIFLSHRKVLQLASEQAIDGPFVVLEDDVQISPKLYTYPIPDPSGVMSDWEMMMVSVRFRRPSPAGSNELLWQGKPFGDQVVTADEARRELIATGAHFCITRDAATAASIVARMDRTPVIEDVDIWFMSNTNCVFWHSDHVGTKSSLGSNHKDPIELSSLS
jgi:hypothetical protein